MPLTIINSSGGGTGTNVPGLNPPIYVNSNTISSNITLSAGTNGLSGGPITISTGFTVTVATGARWVVV